MEYFERPHKIIDPQQRRILYTHADIIQKSLEFGFADTVPQYFVTIISKPDTIYVDMRNNVHCYQKHMHGKLYTVSVLETVEFEENYFSINSWFEEKDPTLTTIQKIVKAADNKELRKKLDEKINDSESWLKILYTDNSYFKAKKFEKRGMKVVTRKGKKVVEVPYNKK